MSRHRSLRLLLAASVIAVVAACSGSAPAAPALTDPVDILSQSVQTLQDVKSFHADVAVSGSVNIDAMGTGSTAAFPLDNTTAQLDVDVENKNAKATFSAPALMGVSGELIQVGGTSYVKTSLTGPLYQKSESEASAVDEATNMTEEDIAQLREQLTKVQPTKGEDVSCGDKQCYTVTVDLDSAELQSLGGELPTEGLPADMSEASIKATFKVEKDTLRPAGVDLTVDLGSQGSVTVAVTLSKWDEAVSIEAPPADQVQS